MQEYISTCILISLVDGIIDMRTIKVQCPVSICITHILFSYNHITIVYPFFNSELMDFDKLTSSKLSSDDNNSQYDMK